MHFPGPVSTLLRHKGSQVFSIPSGSSSNPGVNLLLESRVPR